MSTLLSTAYLGNIQYYTKLISGEAEIDLWENYRKQSYRNRCDVLTPNGVCSLIVPVLHPSGQKIRTKEVRIDNSKKWRHQHWQTIVSAYGRAPFFDHYAGAFESMYATEYELLAEWNRDLLQLTLRLLHLDIPVVYTDAYREAVPEASDFRDAQSALQPEQSCVQFSDIYYLLDFQTGTYYTLFPAFCQPKYPAKTKRTKPDANRKPPPPRKTTGFRLPRKNDKKSA